MLSVINDMCSSGYLPRGFVQEWTTFFWWTNCFSVACRFLRIQVIKQMVSIIAIAIMIIECMPIITPVMFCCVVLPVIFMDNPVFATDIVAIMRLPGRQWSNPGCFMYIYRISRCEIVYINTHKTNPWIYLARQTVARVLYQQTLKWILTLIVKRW